jgi:hypothetical protein
MVVRRLVAFAGAAAVAVAVALPATSAYAALPSDVYVATPGNGGNDANDCSQGNPCATVGAAVQAVADLGTIHVGVGVFDGPIRPNAVNKSVTIDGASSGDTTVTNSGLDGFVVEVDSHTTTLSNLTASGGLASTVLVTGGTLVADHVVLETAGCVLAVFGGKADVTDSTIQDGGHGGAFCDVSATSDPTTGDVGMAGGSVSLVRTQVLSPETTRPAVKVKDGTFSADQSYFDDSAHQPTDTNSSDAVQVKGGTATVTRSTIHGFGGSGVFVTTGTALVADDTFEGNVVGVRSVEGGVATVVRSTLDGEGASFQQEATGALSVAGSILGTDSIATCAGTITDLGYNLATDDSCGFSGTSKETVTGLNLDSGLADRGGPVPTVAILDPSSAVDTIPAGATYGVSATPLCPASGTTDLRGVPRPVSGTCDAGSMEMAGTTTTLDAPAKAAPHADVTLDATVDVPQVIDGPEPAVGTVTFRSGSQVLCQDVTVASGAASCTTSALAAGSRSVTAAFTPAAGSTLHASVSAARTIKVGIPPAFTSRSHTTFRVGKRKTFTVQASGSPGPRITLVKGKLPAGLHFDAGKGTAIVFGKAKRSGVGTHRVTLRASNLRGTVHQVLRIVVKA